VNRFIEYSQVLTTSNYTTLKNTVALTHKEKASASACLVVSWSLKFSLWMYQSRTELTSCGQNMEHPVGQSIPLLFSVVMKCVSVSRQRVNLYKRFRCLGNVFQLAVN
jgi:hypothetical protein